MHATPRRAPAHRAARTARAAVAASDTAKFIPSPAATAHAKIRGVRGARGVGVRDNTTG